jgi:hypothetical protein
MAFPPFDMAESDLKCVLLQAGAIIATASSVTRFEGSRRRSAGDSSPDAIPKLLDLLDAQLRQLQLHLAATEENNGEDVSHFVAFYGVTAVNTLFYELEHELLAAQPGASLVRIFELLDPLKLTWKRLLMDENGELDTWFIDYSLSTTGQLRKIFTEIQD